MKRPSPASASVIAILSIIAVLAAMFCLLLAWMPRSADLHDGMPLRSPAAGRNPPRVGPGTFLERDLRSGSAGDFLIPLEAGDYLQAVVEQRGVDVAVTVFDPGGHPLLKVDSPNGKEGPEPVFLVAATRGGHRLRVAPLEPDGAGRYALKIEALRPASRRDRLRSAAAGAFARGEELRARGGTDSLRAAREAYRAALRDWRSLAEPRQEGASLRRIGQVSNTLVDLPAARAAFEQALAITRALSDRAGEARLLNDAGAVYLSLSELTEAERAFLSARDLHRSLGDRRGEATALNNLGALYDSRGDLEGCLEVYGRALAIFRELGDSSREAITLHNLGRTYSLLGRPEEALAFLRQALSLRRAAGDHQGAAAVLTQIGWVYYLSGDLPAALRFYEQSLALSRREGDVVGEAATLDRRGTALARMGRLEAARASYEAALAVFQRAGQPENRAHTLANLGWLHEARGDPEAAVAAGEQALRLFRETGDRYAEAYTLLGLARAERRRGNRTAARSRAEESIDLVESLRSEAPIQALRTSLLASRQDHYEFAIDLLMEMKLGARSWETAERARTRSLLESLGGGAAIEEDLRPLVLKPGELGGHTRAGAATRPLSLREAQRLLDRDTLLLQYSLGEERSFLWIVGPDSLSAHALPGRRRIEDLTRRAHSLLPRSHKRSVRQQARLITEALSGAVLGPAARELGKKRLLIAADGALHSIPFGALPVLCADGRRRPLLAEHEIVYLPSISVLARLRRERTGRLPPSPSRLVAVIADPVFESSDPRVTGRPAPAAVALAALPAAGDLERSASDLGMKGFVRLLQSRREAEAILSLVPPGESLRALDFEARRETVLSGRLRPYRIVHFATHGLLNAEHPGLSGLVLSQVDERGRPRDGFLRVHEIRGLDLSADLVVLSACRTGLGREIRGEGLLGLPQAFLQAGAARVVVSLWNVNDAATSELMSRFYRALLRQRLSPGQALRDAQLSLLREDRWEAPYYWAGFTLHGDWAPSP